MKPSLIIITFLFGSMSLVAQQPAGDKEKMLNELIKSGYLRKEGNLLIFKVEKASDTPSIKLIYGTLFNNSNYSIAFEVDRQYFNKDTKIEIPPVRKNAVDNDCVKDIKSATVKQLIESGRLKLKGNRMSYYYRSASDSIQFRHHYPCKLRYDNKIYELAYVENFHSNSADSLIAVTTPVVVPVGSVVQFQFLKNPDFEMGYTVPHWQKAGEAFREPHESQNMLTWKDMKVVSVGGNYWTDLSYSRGYHARYWISSLPTNHGVEWEQRRRSTGAATGTLTSEPFKIYAFQKYISFLVAGGKDERNLKVELLRMQLRGSISGDLSIEGTRLPGVERTPIRTSIDTNYISIAGIDAKTGRNNEVFCREWWDIRRLDTSGYYVIRITDNSQDRTGWGYINVDDFRFLSGNPLSYSGQDSLRIHGITIKNFVTNANEEVYVDYYTPLFGAADTHTHLMSHLSMGRKLMYGAPDIGSIVPAGTLVKGFDAINKECNTTDIRATTIEEALGNCNAAHGGWGIENDCGNYLRAMLINLAFDGKYVNRVPFESNMHGDHPHAGYPRFEHWPHQSSMSHQQMWVDWIKRAYEGGMRVLVTLAVNNELLGNMVSGDPPYDDKSAYDLQLDEIRSFVERHNDFMELALSSADMRRIVQSGKLAVIMGIEVDNLGNFNYAGNIATESRVRQEIQRVYDKGVRYIFPIHLTDNKFGGMAVYSVLFGFSNKFANTRPSPIGHPLPPGNMLMVEPSRDPRVNYRLTLLHNDLPAGTTAGLTLVAKPILDFIGELSFPPLFDLFNCPEAKVKCIPQFKIISSLLSEPGWDVYNAIPGGHVNTKGLTSLGKFAVKEMMKLGMFIDIDHMSEKAVADAFDIAEQLQYPLISGHNGFREGHSEDPDHKVSENNRSRAQMTRLRNLNGVIGVGIGESNARDYLRNFRLGLSMMGNRAVTMGSDINGFVVMPYARPGSDVKYFPNTHTSAMHKYNFGKDWNYNREGVAHIGLYPDYFQDLKNLGMTLTERQVFFNAADYLVNMWQRCERYSSSR